MTEGPSRIERLLGRQGHEGTQTVDFVQGQQTARQEQLLALAREVRSFLEPLWMEGLSYETPPPTPSTGNCVLSNRFLAHVLINAGFDAKFRFGSDAGEGFLSNGVMQAHAWIEVGKTRLDITADQFKGPPILVTTTEDARYLASDSDLHLRKSDAKQIDAWMKLWHVAHQRPAPSPAKKAAQSSTKPPRPAG